MARRQRSEAAPCEQEGLLEDPEFLRGALQRYLQQFLDEEISHFLQAAPYERTGERQGYRNGYKPRQLTTRGGRLELALPQDREGRFHSELFARYQRSEKALLLALQQSYLPGVSTRKVKAITEAVWHPFLQVAGLQGLPATGPRDPGLATAPADPALPLPDGPRPL